MNPARGIFTLYVGRMFLVRFIGLLLFFVILLQMLDLLNRSADILAPEGAGAESLIRYIQLRTPQIISQFTPFAALLGIVVTLAGLSHTSEITIMRAAGMSIHRVLFPFGFIAALIAASQFIFHETVTVKSSQELEYWAANDYALDLPEDAGTRTNINMQFDGETVSADSAARFGDVVLLSDVLIYDYDENELASRVITAGAARYENDIWRLVQCENL